MEFILDDNIYIFNLCDFSDVPLKTIVRIYEGSKGKTLDDNFIKNLLGNTPTCIKIIDKLKTVDTSFLSLYALVSCGINQYIVDSLKTTFSSIEDLSKNTKKLIHFHFQERTINKILAFVENRVKPTIEPKDLLKKIILEKLSESTNPIKKNELFLEIVKQYNSISVPDFYEVINLLISEQIIKITSNGLELKRVSLDDYFIENKDSKNVEILRKYIEGQNINELSNIYSVTRQRVDQIIRKQISKMPIVDNELRYKELISVFKLSDVVMERLGYGDKKLARFVKTKYTLKAQKNDLDYVIEFNENGKNLIGTDLGNYILKKNNLTFVNEKLIKCDFRNLFTEFVSINNLITFNSATILEPFKAFVSSLDIDIDLDNIDIAAFNRRIDNLGDFLNCGFSNYFWLDMERISNEFLDKTRNYLENFYGFGSVEVFYNKNKDLCNEQYITNEYQLFTVMKKLYSEEFSEDIDFIRMPTISTKGLNREDFFIGLIKDLQPISISDFLAFVKDEYGFKKDTLYSNMYNFFIKFLNKDGMLTTEGEDLNPNDSDYQKVLCILGNRKVLPLDEFVTRVKNEIPNRIDFFTSRHIIKRFGYLYRNDSIYKNEYNSLSEAMISVAEDLPTAVSESCLEKYLPRSSINTRYSTIKQEAIFLKFSDQMYLNVSKRINREELLKFRDEIIESLIPDVVYTLDDYRETVMYKRICEKYKEIHKLFEAMNYSLLVDLLRGSLKITSLDSFDPFVFGKGTLVSNKQVIRFIVKEKGSIDKSDLIDLLNNKYGINHDYWNSYFFELGLYYNNNTDKVYVSKERCDQELQEYLNKEDK